MPGHEGKRQVLPDGWIAAPGYFFKEVLTAQDAAEFLGISVESIYQYASRKEIPYYKPGGRLFFKKSELENFAFRNRQSAGYEVSGAADAILNGEKP